MTSRIRPSSPCWATCEFRNIPHFRRYSSWRCGSFAGGLAPDAETVDAQVFRYMPDSTLKILNVKLDSALDGNPADNIVLNRGIGC